MFHAYLLRCADASYYVGHTDDLPARIAAHQRVCGYTVARLPIELVWSEAFATRDLAFRRERQLKGWSRAKKEALIAGDWRGLSAAARSPERQGAR